MIRMAGFSFGFLVLAGCTSTDRRSAGQPSRSLSEIEAATVVIAYQEMSESTTGLGLVFHHRDNQALVLTAHSSHQQSHKHVSVRGLLGEENTVKARQLSESSIGGHSVRVLLLDPIKSLPQPIPVEEPVEVRQGDAVYVPGIPWGQSQTVADERPPITITKGVVESIDRDKDGNVFRITISGEFHSGHHGAPIVTEDGQFISVVAAAKGMSGTAWGITPHAIRKLLGGRADGVSQNRITSTPESSTYDFVVHLDDPLCKVKEVRVAYVPIAMLKEPPPRRRFNDKNPPPLIHPAMTFIKMVIEDSWARGSADFPRSGMEKQVFYSQYGYTLQDDQWIWSEPVKLEILHPTLFERLMPPLGKVDPIPLLSGSPPPPLPFTVRLTLPDKPLETARLKLNALIGGMVLSPGGSSLYVLDLSEGCIHRIDPANLKIIEKTKVRENATTMAMSPDGSKLYVSSREPGIKPSETPGEGWLQVFAAPSLALETTLQLNTAVLNLFVLSSGTVVLHCRDALGSVAFIDASLKKVEFVRTPDPWDAVKPAFDETRLFVMRGSGGLTSLDLARKGGQFRFSQNEIKGKLNARRNTKEKFEVTPDGNHLILYGGTVLRAPSGLRSPCNAIAQIDPAEVVSMAPRCDTLFTVSLEGFIRCYDLGDFSLRKALNLNLHCPMLVLDPSRSALHAAVATLPENPSLLRSTGPVTCQLASFSLIDYRP
jgi:hypothetical protein